MLNGIYRCVDNNHMFPEYSYTMKVKETKKTYMMKLLKNDSRFSQAHIDLMFQDKEKIAISKEKSAHAITDWGDNSFTIYPFRAGIPYLFELQKEA